MEHKSVTYIHTDEANSNIPLHQRGIMISSMSATVAALSRDINSQSATVAALIKCH